MQKKNLILIGILVFALSLVGTYVLAVTPDPGHTADYIGIGDFGSKESDIGNYTFSGGGNVGIGNSSPDYKLDVTGVTRSSGEIISTSSNAFRMVSGNYGAFFRNDGSNTYFLLTNSGNQYGSWNSLRPFYVNNSSGDFYVGHNIYMGSNKVIDSGGGWHRSYGATGWYNQSYGGGWYMTDTNWIKAYNNKPVVTTGEVRAGFLRTFRSDWSCADMRLYTGGSDRITLASCPAGSGNYMSVTGNFQLNVSSGNFYVRGSGGANNANLHVYNLWKTGGNGFLIDHPAKKDLKLTHISIEGPEYGVYYRGEAQLKSGKAVVKLPDYFEALTRKENRTVQLTCRDGWTPIWVSGGVENGEFVVKTTKWGNKSQKFYWEVKAVRADIEPLKVERKSSEFESK